MKMAIVSTDGKNVDEHFGKADRFLIFETVGAGLMQIEERPVSPLSTGDKSHAFDEKRFDAVIAALEGCSQVYATRIGDRPREELAKRGITAVIYEGAIDAITVSSS